MALTYPLPVEERQRLEAILLGSLFLHPETGTALRALLQSGDFSEERHRLIYEAILIVLEVSEVITVDTVTTLLLEQELERVGGHAYLEALKCQAENSATSVEEQAELMKQASLHHSLRQAGETFHMCSDSSHRNDLQRAAGDYEQALHATQKLLSSKDLLPPPVPFQADLDEYLYELETRRRQHAVLSGISTGFADLDTITGGLQQSDLIIIAGPPSSGKTGFALSIALHVLLKVRRSVGLFSLEASKRQVIGRLLAMEAGLDQRQVRSLEVDDEEWRRLGDVSATLSEADLWIDDTANLSTTQLSQRAGQLVEHCGVELLIVDYVHLMVSNVNGKRYENRVQEMGEISRSLKVLAHHLNVPVLALAQVSRTFESRPAKKLQLTDLRDGSLENDADLVLFLSLAKVEMSVGEAYQLATISLAKQRNGPLADLHVSFHPSSTRFVDLQAFPKTDIPEQSFLSPSPARQPTVPQHVRLQDIMARVSKRKSQQEQVRSPSLRRALPLGYVLDDEEADEKHDPETTKH